MGSYFPEWTVPARHILKQQKVGWDDEFEIETATYALLRLLQGLVIPEYCGELSYQHESDPLVGYRRCPPWQFPRGRCCLLPTFVVCRTRR